jgi:ubiquinone/menaquinone biosynthesis C-methylase UbiE
MGQLAMQVAARVPAQAHRTAYRAQQTGMLFQCLLGHHVLRVLTGNKMQVSPEAQREAITRYRELIERDLDNVEQGLYPKEMLFQFPFGDYLKSGPRWVLDVPRAWWRMRQQNFQDLPRDVDLERYPHYFRRNFHWQTDGYLSRRSADIYDVGVEFLFMGTADVMRRQVIPPVTRFVREHGARELRLLDVGCGTGRMLYQLALAHPELRYFGLDLSPFYLQHARDLLRDVKDVSLVADNAESMPYRDGTFDVVTSVHLFHELPHDARRNVYAEMWRVLRPGGLLVIEDSAQTKDSEHLSVFLGRFSREFHEPYHKGYLHDDIGDALAAQGFEVVSNELAYVAKVVVARKPLH